MAIPTRRWLIAIAVAAYLYFLLPATAVMFYELHHLTGVDFIYWGYSGFKAAGYYLSISPYRILVCVLAAVAILGIPMLTQKLRSN